MLKEFDMGKKSWETCKYAVGSYGNDERDRYLKQYGFLKNYDCWHEEFIRVKVNSLAILRERKRIGEVVARLFCIGIPREFSDEEQKEHREKRDRALEGCKSCSFYKPKDD